MTDLKLAFTNKIIPLLQEYFFGDYGKIGLVLGEGFIRIKESDDKSDDFAEFNTENNTDFERPVYEIINYMGCRNEF
jgi:5-methylcytosine-specific restriction protein B